MALELNAGKVERRDLFFVEPENIEVVEEWRGRSRPPTDAEIIDLADSIRVHGQLQPVVCRRRPEDKKLILVAGFTRTAAMRLIRAGYTGADGKDYPPSREVKLKVLVTECNDETSRITNIVENVDRNATSDVDDAFNQRWLREQCNWEDEKIAALYHCSVAAVTRLRKILSLEKRFQDLIHEGKMTIEGAVTANRLPKDQRTKVIKKATKEDGTVSTAVIRDEVREKMLADHKDKAAAEAAIGKNGEAEAEPAPLGSIPLTLHDVRSFVDEESELGDDARIKKFWTTFALFMAGKKKVQAVRAALKSVAGGGA